MSGADLIANAFGKDDDIEKLDAFDRSTLKLVLRRLGMPKTRIDYLDRDLKEGFSFHWFNRQGFLDHEVTTTRCFHFDLATTLTDPVKSPLLKHLAELWVDQQLSNDLVIFKTFGVGRMVCTVGQPMQYRHHPCSSLQVPFELQGVKTFARLMTFDDYTDNYFTGEEISK